MNGDRDFDIDNSGVEKDAVKDNPAFAEMTPAKNEQIYSDVAPFTNDKAFNDIKPSRHDSVYPDVSPYLSNLALNNVTHSIHDLDYSVVAPYADDPTYAHTAPTKNEQAYSDVAPYTNTTAFSQIAPTPHDSEYRGASPYENEQPFPNTPPSVNDAAFSGASPYAANDPAFSSASTYADGQPFPNTSPSVNDVDYSNTSPYAANDPAFSNTSTYASDSAFSSASPYANEQPFPNTPPSVNDAAYSNTSPYANDSAFSNTSPYAANDPAFSSASPYANEQPFSNTPPPVNDAAYSNTSPSVNDAAYSNTSPYANEPVFTGASSLPYASQTSAYSFYHENINKKPRRKRSSLGKYVLFSLLGAILGGALVFAGIVYIAYNTNFLGALNIQPREVPVATVEKKFEFDVVDSPVMAIFEKVSPSIVGIRVSSTYGNFFFGEQETTGEGSGIIIRSDGYILTNNHVISGEGSIFGQFSESDPTARSQSTIEVILPDNKSESYPATVVGRDSKTDLAVLKIEALNLPAAELGDSDLLRPGELAVAIGNPGGLEYMSSVTDGIISGLNRNVKTEDGREYTLIQTNAAINPGNSGGALANSKGQVIGINTIKVYQTGYEGLGFAIPINAAKEVANNLIDFNYVKGRAKIGIKYRTDFSDNYEYYKRQYDVPKGVFVAEVEPLSGAFKAGIKEGDIITKLNGEVIEDYDELIKIRDALKPGDVVPVEVYRDGETMSMELELSEDFGEYAQDW